MVANPKRMKYDTEDLYSSSEDNFEDVDTISKLSNFSHQTRKSKAKWLSKNAIMARENRLKKKIYINNLENEVNKLKVDNDKYNRVIEKQSMLITDLKNEIKYLKSVIANSSDISKLIKNIHNNTGMSVTTSLDQTLSLNNDYVSKPKLPIARKTAHPWEEKRYPTCLTPDSDLTCSSLSYKELTETDLAFDNTELDAFLGLTDDFTTDIHKEIDDGNEQFHLKEHNYTSLSDNEDVGVCLHVSKKRVSVEFCSTCSNNASEAWID